MFQKNIFCKITWKCKLLDLHSQAIDNQSISIFNKIVIKKKQNGISY
jgi:hypothetical protein